MATSSLSQPEEIKTCTIKTLTPDLWIPLAKQAVEVNPHNSPEFHQLMVEDNALDDPATMELALLVTKYWGIGGVRLTVGFLDNPPAALRTRILSHMNAWGQFCNVNFVETSQDPQVRISRSETEGGGGYWSYLGTDILHISADKPTMNLAGFTMSTSDSSFRRVVRHETGHTLGFPHEHRRKEIVDRIDREKAITYFMQRNHWSRQVVIEQVLTVINESALVATTPTDPESIMCYGLPGSIMKDGIGVPGGNDIDGKDAQFAATVYPVAFDFGTQNYLIMPAARAVNEAVPAIIYDQKWHVKLTGVAKSTLTNRLNNDLTGVTLKLDPDMHTPLQYALNNFSIPKPVVSPYSISGNLGMIPVFQVQEYTVNVALGSVFDQQTAVNEVFSVNSWRPVPYLQLSDTRPNGTAPVLRNIYQGFFVDVAVRDSDAWLYGVNYEINLVGKIVFVRSIP